MVSVIIPVYNTEKYVSECVQSLLAQTYDNLEIILVDDGSTDGSPEICDELAARYDCVTALHQKNSGSGSARNKGLAYAHGDYVTFIDSDDVEAKDCIQSLLRAKEDSVVFSVCGLAYFADESDIAAYAAEAEVPPVKIDWETYVSDMMEGKYAVSVVNKLYDLSVIRESGVRFDTVYRFWEDLRFNIDYLKAAKTKGKYAVHMPKNMYFSRRREGSQTRTKSLSKEKELMESTEALWQAVHEDAALNGKIKDSMSHLYGKYIIYYFYSAGFGMTEYDKDVVKRYTDALKSLHCRFTGRMAVKYLLLVHCPRIPFRIISRRSME